MDTMDINSNRTSVLNKPRDFRMEMRAVPTIGEHDVLVKVEKVGICGSDVHYWHRGYAGRFKVTSPLVLGHESSGQIIKTGSKVTNVAIGDRVALEPGIPCRHCESCREGRYNLCVGVRFCATPPVDGTLCQYFAHPADFCFKLPDAISYEMGALLEPLAVAVYSVRRAEIRMGDAVLVLGAGPIGLMCLLAAKAAGASQVAITDINEQRLAFAQRLGATSVHHIDVQREKEEIHQRGGDMAAQIKKSLGRAPTAALECSGAQSSVQLALKALDSRGIMAVIGRGAAEVSVLPADIVCKEIDIRGVFRYANCYPAALELLISGQINLDGFISHRFGLDQVEDAFQTAHAGQAIKVMIDIN